LKKGNRPNFYRSDIYWSRNKLYSNIKLLIIFNYLAFIINLLQII
jgi:hypothetical protein